MLVTMKLKNIIKRGDIYHFRLAVPAGLREKLNKTEITESLETSNALEAQKKATIRTKEAKDMFAELRRPLVIPAKAVQSKAKTQYSPVTADDLSALEKNLKLYQAETATKVDRLSSIMLDMRKGTAKAVRIYVEFVLQQLTVAMQDDEVELTDALLREIKIGYLADGQSVLEICQQVTGLDSPPKQMLLRRVARQVIAILRTAYDQILLALASMKEMDADILPVNERIGTKQGLMGIKEETPKETSPLLSEVLEECRSSKPRSVSGKEGLKSSVQLLIDWHGDLPISSYDRKKIIAFIDNCLLKTPASRTKKAKWKTIPLRDAVVKCSPEERISPQTMHNILADITTVFSYAQKNAILEKTPMTSLTGRLPKPKKVPCPYSFDEIKKMLELITYDRANPSRYWVVLLGLFSGARLNELCQLHLADFESVDRVFSMKLTGSEDDDDDDDYKTLKRVKTKTSTRTVPIHPELLEIGFKKFVTARKKEAKDQNEPLFSELTYNESTGYRGKISRWFNRTLKPKFKQGKKDRGFHSIRHFFIQQAQNTAQMEPQARHELVGHAYTGISSIQAGYAGKLPPRILFEELKKLDYGIPLPPNPYYKD